MNNRIEGKITISDSDVGCEQEIDFNGRLISMSREVNHSMLGSTKTTVTFVEDPMITSYHEPIRCRCNIVPPITVDEEKIRKSFLKSLRKENDKMVVKIKKQPKEISLEELKQGEEYESVRIYIDEKKMEKIEKQYGVIFGFSEIIAVSQSEIEFKDNYMFLEMDYGYKNVPYEFIEKIEVVEK